MRNKYALIGIAIALVIILGGGAAFLYSKNKPAQEVTTSTSTQAPESETASNSLIGLLKSGKTQQCNFTVDGEDSSTTGVVYVNGDKMRSDITISEAGEESDMYMIRSGNDNYIWGTTFPSNTGIKMTMDLEELANDSQANKYVNPSENVDYDCNGWTPDSSVFIPPADVKFSDISTFLQGAMNAKPTGTSSSSCDICNSLTGDAKTTCRAQLNCN